MSSARQCVPGIIFHPYTDAHLCLAHTGYTAGHLRHWRLGLFMPDPPLFVYLPHE